MTGWVFVDQLLAVLADAGRPVRCGAGKWSPCWARIRRNAASTTSPRKQPHLIYRIA
jgi:hypothetical protein